MHAFDQKPEETQQPTSTNSYGQSHADPRHAEADSTPLHDARRVPLYADMRGPIQPKLKATSPNDIYEREADQIARQVVRQPDELRGGGVAAAIQPARAAPVSVGQREFSEDLERQLASSHNGGSPLSGDVRAFMESRLPYDFSGVRVHTDPGAAQLNEALGARAFTHGGHIFFGAGEYHPHTTAGKELLAHELTHVAQQSAGAGPLAQPGAAGPAGLGLTPAPANLVSGAWQSLGTYSWDHHIVHDHRVVVDVRVGNQSDWEERLKNLDDAEELWQVKGFLETATDPDMVGRDEPQNPARGRNYRNNIQRAPNQDEILEFLRALYSLGGELDLPDHSLEATSITRSSFRRNLNQLISEYQGLYIQDVSEQGRAVESAGVSGIVGETGYGTPIAMIQNAAATAMKTVDVVATAQQASDSAALSDALAMIRNAGRTIRYALEAHEAEVAFNQQVAQTVFDTVWGTLPGGGAVVSAGKAILKAGFDEMLKKATAEDEPANQAGQMLDQFVIHVRQAYREGHLGGGQMGVLLESSVISGFEAAMR